MRTRDRIKHLWLAFIFAALPVIISLFIVYTLYPTSSQYQKEDMTFIQQTINFCVSVILFYNVLSYD